MTNEDQFGYEYGSFVWVLMHSKIQRSQVNVSQSLEIKIQIICTRERTFQKRTLTQRV